MKGKKKRALIVVPVLLGAAGWAYWFMREPEWTRRPEGFRRREPWRRPRHTSDSRSPAASCPLRFGKAITSKKECN